MRESDGTASRVGTFLATTLLLSSIFWLLIIRDGHLAAAGGAYVFGLMWCPGVAALVASVATRRPLREIGWRWPRWRFIALGWGIPLAYASVAYGAAWALQLGRFPNPDFVSRIAARMGGGGSEAVVLTKYVLFQGTAGVLISCLSGLGEELGWGGLPSAGVARGPPLP